MKVLRVGVFAALVATALLATAGVAAAAGVPVEPGRATAGQFQPSAECGCHASLVEQWSVTMHAKALDDPIYTTKLAEAEKATNGALGPFCKKCHGPAATMLGEIASGKLSDAGKEGVSCSFCHQVTGLKDDQPANTSQLVEANGVRRAQIKDPQAPHPAAYSAFHESAEICGGCHNVNHPINGMHLESTYSEYAASPWAKEGVTCQDCHMSSEPGVIGPFSGQAAGGAPTRENIYRMSFVGGNVAQGPGDIATARLQSAAEMKLDAPEIVAPGQTASVTVAITNTGAGHKLPTGLTEVRQMWLEVYATNAAGEQVAIGEHRFGTILQDDKGNAPVELWEATKIKSDDRIGPRETFTESYAFTMPQGVEAGEIVAVLKYQSAPDELAEKAGVENPTTEMVKATSAVYGSEQAKTDAAKGEEPGDEAPGGWNAWIVALGIGVVVAIALFLWLRSRGSGA